MNKEYKDFLAWADKNGKKFPCTAAVFIMRACQYAHGDEDVIDCLCSHGIGPNWKDNE
jgi:hypothetical protein